MKWKKFRFVAEPGENTFDWTINIPVFVAYAAIALIILFGSFFTVAEGQKALITTFGKASDTIYSAVMHIHTAVEEVVISELIAEIDRKAGTQKKHPRYEKKKRN